MTDLGLMLPYLGIEVIQDEDQICLSQASYAKMIVETFKMDECNPTYTPMESNLKFNEGGRSL